LLSEATSGWRDQWVVAIGTAYRPTPDWTLWAGYNHGRNPIPNRYLSPLLMNIGQDHLTAGVGLRFASAARLGLAVEYQLPNEVDYDNAALPLGSELRARTSYVALHLGLSLRW
jgi:long-chain fatty acid transport protein